MRSQPLRKSRVALVYGPGHVGADYAGSLIRGIERALLELGGTVQTLNLAHFKGAILEGDCTYDDDSPLISGIIAFLDAAWPAEGIDICLGLFHDVYLSARLMDVLRRRCRRIINYPLNLLDQSHRFQRALAFCDNTFCAEEEALPALRAVAGDKIRYVPMAADPHIHRPAGASLCPRLLFVGSLYAERARFLDDCAKILPTSIYGPNYTVLSVAKGIVGEAVRHGNWISPIKAARMCTRAALRSRRLLSDEEFVRLAAGHGISVGFSTVYREPTGAVAHKVRLRDYEATMCGLCHITRRLPELERGFKDRQDIILYDSEDEIAGILTGISDGQIPWASIGASARRRALAEHTWTIRLRAAFG